MRSIAIAFAIIFGACGGTGTITPGEEIKKTSTGSNATSTDRKCTKAGQWQCRSKFQCIDEKTQLCNDDRTKHCDDGSDERKSICENRWTDGGKDDGVVTCEDDEWRCATKTQCIKKEDKCNDDKKKHCDDKSDDTTALCKNEWPKDEDKDEVDCDADEWRCENKKQCIKKEDKCNDDKSKQCDDKSDDTAALCKNEWPKDDDKDDPPSPPSPPDDDDSTTPGTTTPDTSDPGGGSAAAKACFDKLDDEFKLDGDCDCEGGLDEKQSTCGDDEFACGDGTCIPGSNTCDGWYDCADYSDESTTRASCLAGGCDGYVCSTGECIPSDFKCDASKREEFCPGSDAPPAGECDGSVTPDDDDDDDDDDEPEPEACEGALECRDGNCGDCESAHCIFEGDYEDIYVDFCRSLDITLDALACPDGQYKCGDGSCGICDVRDCEASPGSPEAGFVRFCVEKEQSGGCDDGEQACKSGVCTKKCDGRAECMNAEGYITYEESEWSCPKDSLGNGAEKLNTEWVAGGLFSLGCREGALYSCGERCIYPEDVCNGVEDCNQAEDFEAEKGKPGPDEICESLPICPTEFDGAFQPIVYFQCDTGQCLPEHFQCDGKYMDCPNGEDEEEGCVRPECPMYIGEFGDLEEQRRCDSGHCIPASKFGDEDCNLDCADGSDEDPDSPQCNDLGSAE